MGLNHLPEVLWPLSVATIAIAFIATAFVQLLKELLPVRRWFQRSYLKGWFMERLKEGQKQIASFEDAEDDLIRLATGGDRQAFYNLETAQLCGQMNSAAQIALAYPARHPDLLRFLAPEAKEDDLDRVVKTTSMPARRDMVAPDQQADMNELLDARNRVTHHLQRSIDALQISMSFRWKLYVQLMVYAVCLVTSLVVIELIKGPGHYDVLEIIGLAVVAGFLSPVISDLAGVIERLRRP
jgi:hypothetical protein